MTAKQEAGSHPAKPEEGSPRGGSSLPESGVSGSGERSSDSDIDTGAALGSNKMLKGDRGEFPEDPSLIQQRLDRYRREMIEDAPEATAREDQQK